MFAKNHPIAWTFHRNTCRWQSVVPPMPDEEPHEFEVYKEYPDRPAFPLPKVSLPQIPLEQAILGRSSCRDYGFKAMTLDETSAVLRAGYGVKGIKYWEDVGFLARTIPSGGALYPLEIYLIVNRIENIPKGVYHYCIKPALLEQVHDVDINGFYLSQLFIGQPYIADSAAILVACTMMERNMHKYGDRGYRYILFEAGHMFQNMLLTANGLGLGTLNLGGFLDDELTNLLQLDPDKEVPLYAMAIGHPKT
jgi:SagB-type dehydrogenase family enzyme